MTAEVIIFPSRCRVGHARKIARTGVAMPELWQRRSYWNKRVDDFRKRLRKIGADSETVECELAEFAELVRRHAATIDPRFAEDDAEGGRR